MKRAWDPTTLNVRWWHGGQPKSGDGLQTCTGRRYLILAVKQRDDGTVRALECMVLPKGEPINGTVFEWRWGRRQRHGH